MERRIRERKHEAIPGALFDASIKPGGKILETYQVKVKEVSTKEVVFEEVYNPQRCLTVSRKQFESGRIGILEFEKVEPTGEEVV